MFEDPDYQMTTHMPPHAAPEATSGDIDLEKGNAITTEVFRKDSAFPVVSRDGDEAGSAGSGDTRSEQSR